ncbi:MAG: prepilin-type N-terminal cleavage/methylation domain-containing protein, partial [Phycisphaerales bacterium]|nr:prepilin-type N-terminal cleavage/methylation domain-containing protein [Phycisphaerales bacterium]
MNATLSHMKRRPRRGFTLLEVTIAFAVLGLGLIMIAAIFPAALLEHSQTVDRSRALDLATNAETLIHNRVDPRKLYVDNVALASGFDSPWYAIPFFNMDATGPVAIVNGRETSWDNAIYPRFDHDSDPTTPNVYPTQVYYSQLNNTPISYFVNLPQLFGVDYLSDTVLPRTADLSAASTNRLMWQGFYRTMASGTKQYSIAVCKIRQNKQYARQVVSSVDAYANPRILDADLM